MAEKNYPVNEAIQVTYQAISALTGASPTMEIFDETGAKDAVDFPDVTMTEIDSTGRYVGSFTPDAEGEWVVMCSAYSTGKVVKQYSVGTHNVSDVGATVDSIDTKVDSISDSVDGLNSPPMIG